MVEKTVSVTVGAGIVAIVGVAIDGAVRMFVNVSVIVTGTATVEAITTSGWVIDETCIVVLN